MKKETIDINETTLKKFVESMRPQTEIRNSLDIGYSYNKNSIEIFEIRPRYDKPEIIMNLPFARIRYYKSINLWKLYWLRANGKWELYDAFPSATHLIKILSIIDEDKNGCFKG